MVGRRVYSYMLHYSNWKKDVFFSLGQQFIFIQIPAVTGRHITLNINASLFLAFLAFLAFSASFRIPISFIQNRKTNGCGGKLKRFVNQNWNHPGQNTFIEKSQSRNTKRTKAKAALIASECFIRNVNENSCPEPKAMHAFKTYPKSSLNRGFLCSIWTDF